MEDRTRKSSETSYQQVNKTFETFSKSANTNTTNTARDLAKKDKQSDKH